MCCANIVHAFSPLGRSELSALVHGHIMVSAKPRNPTTQKFMYHHFSLDIYQGDGIVPMSEMTDYIEGVGASSRNGKQIAKVHV